MVVQTHGSKGSVAGWSGSKGQVSGFFPSSWIPKIEINEAIVLQGTLPRMHLSEWTWPGPTEISPSWNQGWRTLAKSNDASGRVRIWYINQRPRNVISFIQTHKLYNLDSQSWQLVYAYQWVLHRHMSVQDAWKPIRWESLEQEHHLQICKGPHIAVLEKSSRVARKKRRHGLVSPWLAKHQRAKKRAGNWLHCLNMCQECKQAAH